MAFVNEEGNGWEWRLGENRSSYCFRFANWAAIKVGESLRETGCFVAITMVRPLWTELHSWSRHTLSDCLLWRFWPALRLSPLKQRIRSALTKIENTFRKYIGANAPWIYDHQSNQSCLSLDPPVCLFIAVVGKINSEKSILLST